MRKHRLYGLFLTIVMAIGAIVLLTPVDGFANAAPTGTPTDTTQPAVGNHNLADAVGQVDHRRHDRSTAHHLSTRQRSELHRYLKALHHAELAALLQAMRAQAAANSSNESTGAGGAGGPWAELRQCESNGNYSEDDGNGYYGAYQFAASTWQALGYSGLPSQASPAEQDAAAQKLQAESGWGQWPACSAHLGL